MTRPWRLSPAVNKTGLRTGRFRVSWMLFAKHLESLSVSGRVLFLADAQPKVGGVLAPFNWTCKPKICTHQEIASQSPLACWTHSL